MYKYAVWVYLLDENVTRLTNNVTNIWKWKVRIHFLLVNEDTSTLLLHWFFMIDNEYYYAILAKFCTKN